MNTSIPHARTVIAFCVAAIIGYAACSAWAIWFSEDASIRGDVVGTWKSFAVAAFAFWVGASSGGKARDVSQLLPPPTSGSTTVISTTSTEGSQP